MVPSARLSKVDLAAIMCEADMSNRPAVPADIQREILVESGYRCAVCGTPCPLELAHIISWHESRKHEAEDLICLCANCHERADKEKWGEKVLREYKQRPWVLRQYKDRQTSSRMQRRAAGKEIVASGPSAGSSPFIYGRPVRPGEFLNRQGELNTIFNRLHNGESTAVVGEPHIGKSSLLLQLADEATQRAYLGDETCLLTTSFLNLHHIGNDYTPAAFWEKALKPLRKHPGNAAAARRLKQASEGSYAGDCLEELFDYLNEQGRRLVLLLDEFEQLLHHPRFQDFAVFATLRTLSSLPSFALITASRLSLKEMNDRGYELLGSGGSPLFNTQIEVRLGPFGYEAVETLLNRAGDNLSPDDRHFICRVAGRHPFLLQAMAAALIEATGEDRQVYAASCFYEQISYHFDDLWRTLDDRTRTTAVILSLVELGGRALGRDFACGEIERVAAFGPELQKLAERGLAERMGEGLQFDIDHLLLWQGERWAVGVAAFTWWVSDVIIAETRQVPTYDEWLANERYRLLLTQEQWDWLVGTVRNAPEWMVRGVGSLARALVEELTRRKQR